MKKRKFNPKDLLLAFLIFLFLFLLGFYFVRGGYYPVVIAHGNWISARDLSKEYGASRTYYTQTGVVRRLSDSFKSEFGSELVRSSLDRLVEYALIERAVSDLVGRAAKGVVASKLNALGLSDPVIAEATAKLYGLSTQEFTRMVLAPQARREVLVDYLNKEENDVDQWLTETKMSARVLVFSPDFSWDGKQVAVKKESEK